MGELRKFYALANVVFVGRTLVPMGGSDLMEAAGLARPVLFGPHVDNFAEAAELLVDAGGAERVTTTDELTRAVAGLLQERARAAEMGRRGREAIILRRGATERTVVRILDLLREG
jgi:3-deoxy-D-manno-octulosonic-acid transferase